MIDKGVGKLASSNPKALGIDGEGEKGPLSSKVGGC